MHDEQQENVDELNILLSALSQLGCKGEVKIAEWIRGSSIAWTNQHDKTSFSYGNHKGIEVCILQSLKTGKEKISNAVTVNPSLTPSEIACGKGLGFIPSASDSATELSYRQGVTTDTKDKAFERSFG